MKNNVLTNEAFIAKAKEVFRDKGEESTEKQMLRRMEVLVDYNKTLEEALHEAGA